MKKILPLLLALVLLLGGLAYLKFWKNSPTPTPPNPPEESMIGEAPSETLPAAEDERQVVKSGISEPVFASSPRVPWPHETGDIPANPRATFGSFENGFRYVIVPNSEPPKRVALRLHIDAGSLHEADDQRGLAHFLEHMVFNGTTNFPDPKQLIPQMQRLGISFGAHANAYTSFDETVYMLDLPNLDERTLNLAYTVMRDFADGALLKEVEIDNERGVILSEKNSRDSVQMRLMQQQFDFLIPDSLINRRFPIGTEEVISNAQRERFKAFYNNYYVPRKMTFIVVGDIEVADMEARIKKQFASMKNPEQPGAEPQLGQVPSGNGFRASVFADKEVPGDDISLLKVESATPKADSVSTRLEFLPLEVAHTILNRRFSMLAKTEGAPIQRGSASRGVWFQALEFGSIDVTAADGRWEEAVAVLEQEFRRAMEFGFTQAELEEIRAATLNAYEQAVKNEESRESPDIAMQLVKSINDLKSFSSPEENLRIARLGLENLTTESCLASFREFWNTQDFNLILTTKKENEDTKDKLLAAFQQSQSSEVTPPKLEELAPFAYTNFGEPGTITSETVLEDLDATQLVLSNKVRVNFKKTDFQKNSINLLALFGSGKFTQPTDKPGLDSLALSLLNAGGLGQHSEDDLRRILAGKNVGAGFGISDDSISLSGTTTPEDLTLQLQLMCAYLTDPGFRDEALRQFRKALPDRYEQLKHDLSGAQSQMSEWLYGNDPRYTLPPLEKALTYEPTHVQNWVLPQIKQDYLELTIVGDFDPETLKKSLLTTFGALPPRADTPHKHPEALYISFPATPQEKTFTYESQIPKAAAIVLWKIPGVGDNISRSRRFNILAEILGDRMRQKIREELGATYSPSTGSQPSDIYPDFGNLIGFSIAKPEDLSKINDITVELAKDLSEKGANEDELDRALKPALSNLEKSRRENSYWLDKVLSRSQAQPHRLDWARQRDEDYQTIKLADINALAKEFLAPSGAIKVELKPE